MTQIAIKYMPQRLSLFARLKRIARQLPRICQSVSKVIDANRDEFSVKDAESRDVRNRRGHQSGAAG
jgi:hypothetical protein